VSLVGWPALRRPTRHREWGRAIRCHVLEASRPGARVSPGAGPLAGCRRWVLKTTSRDRAGFGRPPEHECPSWTHLAPRAQTTEVFEWAVRPTRFFRSRAGREETPGVDRSRTGRAVRARNESENRWM